MTNHQNEPVMYINHGSGPYYYPYQQPTQYPPQIYYPQTTFAQHDMTQYNTANIQYVPQPPYPTAPPQTQQMPVYHPIYQPPAPHPTPVPRQQQQTTPTQVVKLSQPSVVVQQQPQQQQKPVAQQQNGHVVSQPKQHQQNQQRPPPQHQVVQQSQPSVLPQQQQYQQPQHPVVQQSQPPVQYQQPHPVHPQQQYQPAPLLQQHLQSVQNMQAFHTQYIQKAVPQQPMQQQQQQQQQLYYQLVPNQQQQQPTGQYTGAALQQTPYYPYGMLPQQQQQQYNPFYGKYQGVGMVQQNYQQNIVPYHQQPPLMIQPPVQVPYKPNNLLMIDPNQFMEKLKLQDGPSPTASIDSGHEGLVLEKLKDEEIRNIVSKYLLNAGLLELDEFPRLNKEGQVICGSNFVPANINSRICCRCNTTFTKMANGEYPKGDGVVCRFHHKGSATIGSNHHYGPRRFLCCDQRVNKYLKGCMVQDFHVFDQICESELSKFVMTPKPTGPEDPRSMKLYAIDCEMVYTTAGPALARMSLVNIHKQMLLDIKVKPPAPVIDPNTKFSGLTREDVEGATDTLETCHKKLFELINSDTVLLGHALNRDLQALRLVHSTVVDTSIIYTTPNKKKQSLRNLAAQLLKRSIQQDNIVNCGGHDSKEDAITCIDLLQYAINGTN